jgi:hypothetical protein
MKHDLYAEVGLLPVCALDPLNLADAQEAWRAWVRSHDSAAIKAGQRRSGGRQIRACPACPLSGKPDIGPTSPNERA